jgi:hypothetical protein
VHSYVSRPRQRSSVDWCVRAVRPKRMAAVGRETGAALIAGDPARPVCNLCRSRFACFEFASAAQSSSGTGLFVFLHAVEPLFKLGDERSLARGVAI